MKLWTVEKDTPCLVVKNLKADNAEFVPFMTTVESTFDYPLWDKRQVHNRGSRYIFDDAAKKQFNLDAIRKVSECVERSNMIAFVKSNAKGNPSLILLDEKYVECLC